MSLPNEWHLIGPPGTGKTTRLATRWIPRMVELYGPNAVAVVSLTRAAAKEIASRPGLSLPNDRVSTLHSLARKALTDLMGVPELAQTPESLAEWNDGPAAHNPLLMLSGASARADEGLSADAVVSAAKGNKRAPGDAVTGDGQLARIEVLRQRLVPESEWPVDLLAFWRVWTDWKIETQRMDFTDLIAFALQRKAPLPLHDGVAVAGLIVDEAQDCTDLEMALVRSWGRDLDMLALAGDPNQSIYGFRGAARGAFHPPGFPEERTEVLRQSYRVAKPVQEYAERLSERAHSHVPVEYAPREDADAAVLRPACSILGRTHGAADVAALADRETASLAACAGDHRRVMILSSAGFLLKGVLKELRKRGLLYHNPFAPNRGDWNPMRSAHRHIGSFFIGPRPDLVGEDGPGGREPRLWTWTELQDWVSCCAAKGLLRKGAKTHLIPDMVKRQPSGILDWSDLDRVFDDPAWVRSYLFPQACDPYLEPRAVEWLADAWTPANRKRLDFPLSVARHSVAKLVSEPRIVVGTIHSVKGGTAGAVILAPDLSQRHAREMRRSPDGHDELIRMAYVGVTRASTRLYLLRPCTKYRRMRQYLDL